MKHGGVSAILDLVAREELRDEAELKLKVVREQCTDLGKSIPARRNQRKGLVAVGVAHTRSRMLM